MQQHMKVIIAIPCIDIQWIFTGCYSTRSSKVLIT